MKPLTIGRAGACDLVLDDTSVSAVHARLEVDEDMRLALTDADSEEGTFLQRAGGRIRVRRALLCAGDRFRFGDCEVPVERLLDLLGPEAGRHLVRDRRGFAPLKAVPYGSGAEQRPLKRPRRNPVTGNIEDEGA